MNSSLRVGLGIGVMVFASTLMKPKEMPAYSLLGHDLDISQRDVRLYDVFEPSAHTYFTPHPNWPGYTDTALAVWKGAQEWGHVSFGNGSGDPAQGNVGDGGANFNPIWNGYASASGGGTINTVDGISGSANGVLAFAGGTSWGWDITFYIDAWNWNDNPNTSAGKFDIQAVMCHEYGHALGLGHSNVGGATMWPSIGSGSRGPRSINNDDMNGLQAIYGTFDPNVIPFVDNVTGSLTAGGTVVVTGRNFTFTANRVWMNNDLLDAEQEGGQPFEIRDLVSTNNRTQISFILPDCGYESGGLHIRKGGHGHTRMSNGWPVEIVPGGTCSGSDSINLNGPTSAAPGDSVQYDWDSAPANQPWTLYYSLSNAGSNCLQIGPNIVELASGTHDGSGLGSFIGLIPPGTPTPLTVYLEVQTLCGGTEYDSNVVVLNIN